MIVPILQQDDPRLRQRANEILLVNNIYRVGSQLRSSTACWEDWVPQLAIDLQETLLAVGGIGLAAPQIGSSSRMILIALSPFDKIIMINPAIVYAEGKQRSQEGCLSVDRGKRYASIARAKRITVEYETLDMLHVKRKCTHLMAACVQHEIDHLDGKLFVDYLKDQK